MYLLWDYFAFHDWHGHRERQSLRTALDEDGIALIELTAEQTQCQRVLQLALNGALERASAKRRIIADLSDIFAGGSAGLE